MPIAVMRRYLNSNTEEAALRQAAALLIAKLGETAIEGDPQEANDFRDEIRAIQDGLTADLPPENLLTLADSAARSLETYNRRVANNFARQQIEFQAIVKVVQSALAKLPDLNSEDLRNLTQGVEDLANGGGVKSLQTVKLYLGRCLTGMREQIERERSESSSLLGKLRVEIEGLRGPAAVKTPGKSEVSGPGYRAECVEAIRKAIDRGTRHYAVAMVVNRIKPIAARFGQEAAESMVKRFRQHIYGYLNPADRLFHWTGSATVALLERAEAFDTVSLAVKRMVDVRLEEDLLIGGRSVLVPISAAWTVFIIGTTAAEAEKRIHAFVTSQGGRDFA